jgi:hypothetical protein
MEVMPEVNKAQLPRVKVFQQHLTTEPDMDKPDGWLTSAATPDIDTLIEDWVEETGNIIIRVSSPNWLFSWLDNDQTAKGIILGVSVLYRHAMALNNEQEEKGSFEDGNFAPDASSGAGNFRGG